MSSENGKHVSDVGGKAIAAALGATVGGVPGAVVAVGLEPVFIHMAAKSWEELRADSIGRRNTLIMEVCGGDSRLEQEDQ